MKMYFILSQYGMKKKVLIVKWSRAHDQNDLHAQKCSKPKQIFFLITTGPFVLRLVM